MNDFPVLFRAIYKDDCQKTLAGVADCLVADFALEFAVLNHDQVGIGEHALGRFKSHAMLLQIPFRFGAVPGELDFQCALLICAWRLRAGCDARFSPAGAPAPSLL